MKRRLYRWASNALLLPIIFLWCLAFLLINIGKHGGWALAKLANHLADVSDRWLVSGTSSRRLH